MSTLSLFEPNEPAELPMASWDDMGSDERDPAGLRYYQRMAVAAVMKELETKRSTLVVMATGLGKTQVFSTVVKEWVAHMMAALAAQCTHGRVLVLAHREELVFQARDRLVQITGESVEVEKAQMFASQSARIVVASIQTISAEDRLKRWPADHFDLIVTDEAHHYIASTYKRPLDYFASAKLFGVTATPDRADERAMGMIFDSVAYSMDIEDGINEGFLVPVRGKRMFVDKIDLSQVGVSKGDLKTGELDEEMLKGAESIVAGLLAECGTRQCIVFCPGVKTAHYVAQKLNEIRPGCAMSLDKDTPKDQRRPMVKDFRAGRFQFLSNCMVATEGFDAPAASVVAIARPTKSRSLYAQMVGRGTRVLPNVIESAQTQEAAGIRRRLIAESAKPDMLILDFVGNSGSHDLASPEDILGGKYTDAEVKHAKKMREKEGGGEGDVQSSLKRARNELAALAKMTKAEVQLSAENFNPFSVFKVQRDQGQDVGVSFGHEPATQAQRDDLAKMGFTKEDMKGLTKQDYQRVLKGAAERRAKHLASYKQLKQLAKFGLFDNAITFAQASNAMTYLQGCQWNPKKVDRMRLNEIVGHKRQPGEE